MASMNMFGISHLNKRWIRRADVVMLYVQ